MFLFSVSLSFLSMFISCRYAFYISIFTAKLIEKRYYILVIKKNIFNKNPLNLLCPIYYIFYTMLFVLPCISGKYWPQNFMEKLTWNCDIISDTGEGSCVEPNSFGPFTFSMKYYEAVFVPWPVLGSAGIVQLEPLAPALPTLNFIDLGIKLHVFILSMFLYKPSSLLDLSYSCLVEN